MGANNLARKVTAIYNAYMDGKKMTKVPPTHGKTSSAKLPPMVLNGTEFKTRAAHVQFFYGVNEFREVPKQSAAKAKAAKAKAKANTNTRKRKAKVVLADTVNVDNTAAITA